MTLVSGYEEIKLQNNTIHLCDPISGTITKYYSYGVNTITVEPYTQIRFTRDNIFYVSVKDWNMHMLDKLGQELSVMSISSQYDYYYPINETDYIMIDPASGEIIYSTGFMDKTFYMDKAIPMYEQIEYKDGIMGVRDDKGITLFKYTGELINNYKLDKITDFSVIPRGILVLQNSKELRLLSSGIDSIIYRSNESYTDIDHDNNRTVLYNRQTGQALLIELY